MHFSERSLSFAVAENDACKGPLRGPTTVLRRGSQHYRNRRRGQRFVVLLCSIEANMYRANLTSSAFLSPVMLRCFAFRST